MCHDSKSGGCTLSHLVGNIGICRASRIDDYHGSAPPSGERVEVPLE
jgi:hypothetical protein